MPAPERLTPEQLPDPWLIDSRYLLSELSRVREDKARRLDIGAEFLAIKPTGVLIGPNGLRWASHIACVAA